MRIAHLWAVDGLEAGAPVAQRFGAAGERGFYSLLHLLQALGRPPGVGKVELTVVTSGLHDVLGQEPLEPEKSPLLALCAVAPQEYHELRCRSVDLALDAGDPEEQGERLLTEIASGKGDARVALRGARRWALGFKSLPGQAGAGPLASVRPRGTYLVTGGLGHVGFVAAMALARGAQAKLVLLSRSALPDRNEWDRWLESHPDAEPTSLRIRKVRALEAAGAEVLAVAADVADPGPMRRALDAARGRFGDIHGVVHAAGLLGPGEFGPIQGLSLETCERLFAAKVRGLLVLESLLAEPAPDFWLLTSSLSAVLGGLGYAAYAAGNVFLDHFARARGRLGGAAWTSVDFDQWSVAGRVHEAPGKAGDPGATAITPREGLGLIEHLLRTSVAGQVVVSTTPLHDRLARWVGLEERPAGPAPPPASAPRPRPELPTPYVAPRNETERALAGILEELLGIGPIGVNDDFFALGGHSLFAARTLSRLRAAFGLSLPLSAFFAAPTVAGLGALVAAARAAQEDRSRPEAPPAGDRVEIEI